MSSLWVTAQTYVYKNNTSIKEARGDWLSGGVNDGRLIISCDTDDSSMFTLARWCPEGRKTQVTHKRRRRRRAGGTGSATSPAEENERARSRWGLARVGEFSASCFTTADLKSMRTLALNDVGTVIHHQPGLGSSAVSIGGIINMFIQITVRSDWNMWAEAGYCSCLVSLELQQTWLYLILLIGLHTVVMLFWNICSVVNYTTVSCFQV